MSVQYGDDVHVRLEFRPLWRQVFLRFDEPIWDRFWQNGFTMSMCADLLDVARETLQIWKRDGVPVYSADKAAVRLGLHPVEIWGADWWQAIGCGGLFATKPGPEPDERWYAERLAERNANRPDLVAMLLADVDRLERAGI